MKTIGSIILLTAAAALLLAGCKNEEPPKPKIHTVTVVSTDGGTAKAEPAEAVEGATVTLTATPYAGYDFEKWTVTTGDFTLENAATNPANFKMPAQDVEIMAEFAELDVFKHIPDAVFLEYCRQFDTNGDDRLSLEEAALVTEIGVDNKGIASLAGIEYFVSLEDLGCAGNQLEALDLSSNTALKILWCIQSQLTSLDISANRALTDVYCNDNRLTELDASSMVIGDNGKYTLYCGRQKTAEGEDRELTLTLREEMKEYWTSSLASSPTNSNIVLAD